MPFCPQCSQSVGTDDKFCARCGRDLTAGLSVPGRSSPAPSGQTADAAAKKKRIFLIVAVAIILDIVGMVVFFLMRP